MTMNFKVRGRQVQIVDRTVELRHEVAQQVAAALMDNFLGYLLWRKSPWLLMN